MTIEELLELPAADIAQLTDAELARHLRQYFPHTRPAGVIDNALSVALSNKETAISTADKGLLDYERKIQAELEKANSGAAGSGRAFTLSPGKKRSL